MKEKKRYEGFSVLITWPGSLLSAIGPLNIMTRLYSVVRTTETKWERFYDMKVTVILFLGLFVLYV